MHLFTMRGQMSECDLEHQNFFSHLSKNSLGHLIFMHFIFSPVRCHFFMRLCVCFIPAVSTSSVGVCEALSTPTHRLQPVINVLCCTMQAWDTKPKPELRKLSSYYHQGTAMKLGWKKHKTEHCDGAGLTGYTTHNTMTKLGWEGEKFCNWTE